MSLVRRVADMRALASLPRPMKDMVRRMCAMPGNAECRRLSEQYDIPGGYRRIYFHHIRKTAGTSFNRAFMGSAGEDAAVVHKRLLRTLNKRTTSNGQVFVAHNPTLIEQGLYFYAFSHHPAHFVHVPPETFTITCLRDPAKRVLSHYRMLLAYRNENANVNSLKLEGPWLGGAFSDFLRRMPKDHLLRQLYMFSQAMNVSEAVERIMACSYVLFTEQFASGLQELGRFLGLDLPMHHERRATLDVELNEAEQSQLREMLEPEYELLQRVRAARNASSAQGASPVTHASESS